MNWTSAVNFTRHTFWLAARDCEVFQTCTVNLPMVVYWASCRRRADPTPESIPGCGYTRRAGHSSEGRTRVSAAQLVTRLLELARLDRELFALTGVSLNLADLVDEVAEELRPLADGLHTRFPDSLVVQGYFVRLREVLINLLTHAIQHSPMGSSSPSRPTSSSERPAPGPR